MDYSVINETLIPFHLFPKLRDYHKRGKRKIGEPKEGEVNSFLVTAGQLYIAVYRNSQWL